MTKGQMQANAEAGMLVRESNGFFGGRAVYHQAGGGEDATLMGLNDRAIDGGRAAEIVGVYDEAADGSRHSNQPTP